MTKTKFLKPCLFLFFILIKSASSSEFDTTGYVSLDKLYSDKGKAQACNILTKPIYDEMKIMDEYKKILEDRKNQGKKTENDLQEVVLDEVADNIDENSIKQESKNKLFESFGDKFMDFVTNRKKRQDKLLYKNIQEIINKYQKMVDDFIDAENYISLIKSRDMGTSVQEYLNTNKDNILYSRASENEQYRGFLMRIDSLDFLKKIKSYIKSQELVMIGSELLTLDHNLKILDKVMIKGNTKIIGKIDHVRSGGGISNDVEEIEFSLYMTSPSGQKFVVELAPRQRYFGKFSHLQPFEQIFDCYKDNAFESRMVQKISRFDKLLTTVRITPLSEEALKRLNQRYKKSNIEVNENGKKITLEGRLAKNIALELEDYKGLDVEFNELFNNEGEYLSTNKNKNIFRLLDIFEHETTKARMVKILSLTNGEMYTVFAENFLSGDGKFTYDALKYYEKLKIEYKKYFRPDELEQFKDLMLEPAQAKLLNHAELIKIIRRLEAINIFYNRHLI